MSKNKPNQDTRQFRALPIETTEEGKKRGILATESPVPMPDFERMEMVPEILCIDGCKTRGKELKLVDSHGVNSVRNVLGSFKNIERRGADDRTPFKHIDGVPDISKAEPDVRTKFDEGHINEMSVGYTYNPERSIYIGEGETHEHKGVTYSGPANLRTEWTATEASLVVLGADELAQARGYKSIDDAFGNKVDQSEKLNEISKPIRGTNLMEDKQENKTAAEAAAAPAAPVSSDQAETVARIAAAVKDSNERASAIASLGEQFNCSDKARSAIENGIPVEQFARDIAGNLPEPKPVQTDAIPWKEKEARSYSLGRALQLLAEGKPVDGLEGEVSAEVGVRSGKGASSRGFYLPSAHDLEQFGGERATLTAGTAATLGNVVQTTIGANEYMPYFRPTPVMWSMGARVMTGVKDNFDITTGLTAAVATTKAESTAHAESNPTSKKVSFTPHAYGFFTVVSKRLLRQSAINVESYLRGEMESAITIALDADGLNGSGTNECDGIIGHTDAGTVTITSADAPTYAEILEFEADVETANALNGNLGFIVTPTIKNNLRQTAEYGTDRNPIWTNGAAPSEGLVAGYRAISSNQCPSSRIVFGDFSKYQYVIFDGVEITVTEDATLAKQRDVQYTCNMDIDGKPIYGEAFSTDA